MTAAAKSSPVSTVPVPGEVILDLPGNYAVVRTSIVGRGDDGTVRATSSSGGKSALSLLSDLFSRPPPPPTAPPPLSALLGDAWSSSSVPTSPSPLLPSAPRAFAAKSLRSVDAPASGKIRVAFRNCTPVPLVLCWVNGHGVPYHFYTLDPAASKETGGGAAVAKKKEDDDVVREEDHIETTCAGHAFVLALKYETTAVDDDADRDETKKDGRSSSSSSGEEASRASETTTEEAPADAVDLLPNRRPTAAFGLLGSGNCFAACHPGANAKSSRGKTEAQEPQEGEDWNPRVNERSHKALNPRDVVGGYRPLRRTLPVKDEDEGKEAGEVSDGDDGSNSSSDDERESECVHIVMITRRRRGGGRSSSSARGVRGWFGGRIASSSTDAAHDGWIYDVKVRPGRLDATPLDTSDKVYREMTLGGWPVMTDEGLCWSADDDDEQNGGGDDSSKTLTNGAKDGNTNRAELLRSLLASDLAAASALLPPAARLKLRSNDPTPIWINLTQKYGPKAAPIAGRGMCYHSASSWLVKNGMSANKQGGVELYCLEEYPDSRDLWGHGGVMLHELSHAYHDKCVEGGFENQDVKGCYDLAMKEGLYDTVRVHGSQGPTAKAYACDNCMEYFAELSAAFLGGLSRTTTTTNGEEKAAGENGDAVREGAAATGEKEGERPAEGVEYNKWYPFNRDQVREHDPRAYAMLAKVWGVDVDMNEKQHDDDGGAEDGTAGDNQDEETR